MAEPAPEGDGVAAAFIGDVPFEPPPAGEGVAAAFIGNAPFEILKPLLDCLLPKWILRMRKVCKAWRDNLGDRALLTRLNRAEPPQPLLCFDRSACPDRYIHISDYCVDSLDLRSGKPRSVLRFTDNDDKPQVTVHASLDGYLLVSFFSSRRSWYIINPATRRWVPIFDLTAFDLDVIGFYQHRDSREYRVLCLRRSNPVDNEDVPTYTYTILEFKPGQRRHKALPISSAAREDHGLRFGVERACISPPIQRKRGNMDLLWPPQQSQGYHMLVFDTTKEVFSWKRPPPPVAMTGDQDMRLLEFPDDGNIGLSVSRANEAMLELWCLQDYHNEVWVRKLRIQFGALQQMPALQLAENRPWIPAVVSAEGDVLIESPHGQFHCDRDGNLLHRFWFDQNRSHRVLPIRHVLKRSFSPHPMFEPSKKAAEPPLFRWLGTDAD